MKKITLIVTLALFGMSNLASANVARWQQASQVARNLSFKIENVIRNVDLGTRCEQIRQPHRCQQAPGCVWDRREEMCVYRNTRPRRPHHRPIGGGLFGRFANDLESDLSLGEVSDFELEEDLEEDSMELDVDLDSELSEEEAEDLFGGEELNENDIAAGIALAVLGMKVRQIADIIDTAAALYPSPDAYYHINRAKHKIQKRLNEAFGLQFLLLIPNDGPRQITQADFQMVINDLQLMKQLLG